MTLQRGVNFKEYFRCYVVGQEEVHIMPYDPRAPFHERYVKNPPEYPAGLLDARRRPMPSRCAGRSATTSTPSSSRSRTACPTPSTS